MQEDPILIYDPKISKSSQFSPEINDHFSINFPFSKKSYGTYHQRVQ